MAPSLLNNISSIHQQWQAHLSVERRQSVAQTSQAACANYGTPWEGRKHRFYADVAQVRHKAQDNALCRHLDAAFARAQSPAPLMAPQANSHRAWVVAGCAAAAVVRQLVDLSACLVGACVGAYRLFAPQPAWRGALVATQTPHVTRQLLQDNLRERHPGYIVNKQYVGEDGTAYSLCQQFVNDSHRSNIALGVSPESGALGAATPWPRETTPKDYSAALLRLCDGESLWAQHLSRMLSQELGNAIVETVANHPLFALHGQQVSNLAAQFQESTHQLQATRIGPDQCLVRYDARHPVRMLRFAENEGQAILPDAYCTGDAVVTVGVVVDRPQGMDTWPEPTVIDFSLTAPNLAAAAP